MINWDEFNEICKLRDSGRPAEALEKLERLVCSDDEERATVLLHQSLCHRNMGKLDRTIQATMSALDLLPAESACRPFAEFCLAGSYESAGNFEQAAAGFRAFLQDHAELLKAEDLISLKSDAQHHLATVLIMLKQYHEALFLLEAIEPLASGDELAEVHYRKGLAHQFLGKEQLALESFRQALAGHLNSQFVSRAHFAIGEILYATGELSTALAEFELAIQHCEQGSTDLTAYTNWLSETRKHLLQRRLPTKVM